MDGTQTTEPTEAGPGSPGEASAFRRALDDQAVSEGPLDLTTPLDIAEIRAALSNSGNIPVVRDPAPTAPPRAPGARRASRHASSKRLGRIAVFVAVAASLSVGTACALVLSSGSQGTSVSLPPTTGNIPVAPSDGASQQGQISLTSGSTSASATPSLSLSPTPGASTGSPSASADPGASASGSGSASGSASAGSGTSATPSAGRSTGSQSGFGSDWVTLYWGVQNEDSEVSRVQSLLANIGYLDTWRHHSYANPQARVQPDQDGSYGSATGDAVAEFQQDYNVNFSGQQGTCDLTTYNALVQAAG